VCNACSHDLGEHDGFVRSVAWSPDGRRALSGGSDHKVKLWYVGGANDCEWALLKDLGEHDGYVNSVAWSPDGRRALRLSQPLPERTGRLVRQTSALSMEWLSKPAISTCLFGISFHYRFLLSMLQAPLLVIVAMVVAKGMNKPLTEFLFFAFDFSVLGVATNVIMLFECDDRLLNLDDTIIVIRDDIKTSFLVTDYNVDCKDPAHVWFQIAGTTFGVLWCVVLPLSVLVYMIQYRSALNPQLPPGETSLREGETGAILEIVHSMSVPAGSPWRDEFATLARPRY